MERRAIPREASLNDSPLSYVPTPSAPYRIHRKSIQLTAEPGTPKLESLPQPATAPAAFSFGSRVLMWKQDPSVTEIGTRKAFLPGIVLQGPKDARITNGMPGIPAVSPNAFGDFIMPIGTDQFDAVHTFAVVRQTLTMYQRALAASNTAAQVPFQWNNASNSEQLEVFPHGLPNVMNAYYSRNQKALKFGHFIPSGSTTRMFTCRSFDIVSHETGHAILDGLKPHWLSASAPPQTGGLHESFGDLTAIFLALAQFDQVEAVIAQTKANLHDKNFLADMAEQFGLALGRPNGLRNADNDLKLSDTGTEVHAISQVFTGAIYDILADIFTFERKPGLRDDAQVLFDVATYLRSLLLRALVASPDDNAIYFDVANQMMSIADSDGKPVAYRNFIRNRFTVREVFASNFTLATDHKISDILEPCVVDATGATQNRRTCCGTMNHFEYFDVEKILNDERAALMKACGKPAAQSKPLRTGKSTPS